MTLILICSPDRNTIIVAADGTSLIQGAVARAKVALTQSASVALAAWGDFAPSSLPLAAFALAETSRVISPAGMVKLLRRQAENLANKETTNAGNWWLGVVGWEKRGHPCLVTLVAKRRSANSPKWRLGRESAVYLKGAVFRGCHRAEDPLATYGTATDALHALVSVASTESNCRGICGDPRSAVVLQRP